MSSERSPSWKWWVCGTLLLATMINYMDRQALAQTATELKKTYHLDDARYGMVEAYFSYAFGIGAILFGTLADTFGPRRIYPIALFGWSIAGLLTPLLSWPSVTDHFAIPDDPGSGPYNWLLGCRTMLGFFEAGHWPCALITARQVLTAKDRPLGNGILQSGATIGTVIVISYVAVVRNLDGSWQTIFWTVGAAGLLWLPLWFWLIKPGDLEGAPPPAATDTAASRPGVGTYVRMFLTLIFVVSSIAISWQVLRAWLPKYLVESQGFSSNFRDGAVIAYNLFADVGSLMSGIIVYRLMAFGLGVHASRVIGFAFFCGVTAMAALVPVVGGGYAGVVLLIIAGAGILGLHPYYYSLVQELPAKNMGKLSGCFTCCAWFATAAAQGFLGQHIKETGSYDLGFVIVALSPLVGLVAMLVLWRPGRVTPSTSGIPEGSTLPSDAAKPHGST